MQIIQEVGLKRVIKYGLYTCWQIIFQLLLFSPLRIFWLKLWGAKVGHNTFIDAIDFFNLDRTGLQGLTIGSHCFIGRGCLLDLAGRISLADWVTVAPRVTILSHFTVGLRGHPLLQRYPPKVSHTRLQAGCFIGVNSTILPGIVIGSEAVVAAGSVITNSVANRILVAGSPAVARKHL